jgi:uncharacterized membrane protein YdbT with pleckstrin-like domain
MSQDIPSDTPRFEEALVWQASEGQVVNLGAFVLCGLTCWLVLPLLYAIWRFCQARWHTYHLTPQRLRECSGLLNRKHDELELFRVKDISVERPFLQRLWGCGQVILRTSDRSTPVVTLNAVPEPLKVADLLREHVKHCRTQVGVREID